MIDLKQANYLDTQDVLKTFRKEFYHNSNEIYLDGNSLGKLPVKAKDSINNVVENQWGQNLIRSWNDHWLSLSTRIESKLATLLGGSPDELKVGESTSVNLYKLIHALLSSTIVPKNLITDSLNFPTDVYIMEGLAKQFHCNPTTIVSYSSDLKADLNLLKKEIKENPGIVCLSLVSYKSSWLYPMRSLNEYAEENNSIIVWDLSHAVGVVDVHFKESKTKIALGCTYKFLNGGPGAPSFIYIKKDLISRLNSPIQGWFGHEKPFDFSLPFIPAKGINRFDAGTPQIISMVAMEAGIDLTIQAGVKRIRQKSQAQTQFLVDLINLKLHPYGFEIETPSNSNERGSHITLKHKESWRICKALIVGKAAGVKVIPDFRPPDYLRLGVAPIYTSYLDLFLSVERIEQIMQNREYEDISSEMPTVT